MKKNLVEDAQKIMSMMGRMNLTELNVKYMDELLDKISASGMESLSDYEQEALQKLSQGEEANAPEVHSLGNENTLRFTATNRETGDPLVRPPDMGQTFGEAALQNAFIQGEAADLAGNDVPVFIDGDLSQLDLPAEEQDIRLMTDQGEWECVAQVSDENGAEAYFLQLKPHEEDPPEDDELAGLNEDMSEYKIFNEADGFASVTDATSDELGDINEGNAFVGAAKKAREAGKDSFELNGKTYSVTIRKTEEN